MKRKLEISDLTLGMYVSDLDRPWIETPFLFQGFRITNQEELDQLAEVCDYVLVDVEKSRVSVTKGIVVADEPAIVLDFKRPPKPYLKSFEEEYDSAKLVYSRSLDRVSQLFSDTRLGRNLAMTEVTKTVFPLADSIFSNPDALTLFSNIKAAHENLETHSLSTCILTLTFARHLGLEKNKMYELGIAALLHDIGETQIPFEILNKRGKLSEEEDNILRTHCELGAAILSEVNGIPNSAISVAQHHHERANRSGYPDQLSGDNIGLFTKIISIVDVYDVLTTGFHDQSAITCSEALKHMYDWRKDLFDPTLVEQFIQCLGIYPVGSGVELNTGDIGVVISVSEHNRLSPKIMLIRNEKNQSYLPPKIIDIAYLNEAAASDDGHLYEITKVISPEIFNINLKDFILRELTVSGESAAS